MPASLMSQWSPKFCWRILMLYRLVFLFYYILVNSVVFTEENYAWLTYITLLMRNVIQMWAWMLKSNILKWTGSPSCPNSYVFLLCKRQLPFYHNSNFTLLVVLQINPTYQGVPHNYLRYMHEWNPYQMWPFFPKPKRVLQRVHLL